MISLRTLWCFGSDGWQTGKAYTRLSYRRGTARRSLSRNLTNYCPCV